MNIEEHKKLFTGPIANYPSEHDDHQNALFTIRVEYFGEVDPKDYYFEAKTIEEARNYLSELHTVIHYNNNIVLTMYEYCYFLWYINSGKICMSNLNAKDYKICDESLNYIKELNKNV